MSHLIFIMLMLLSPAEIQEIHFGNGGGFSGLSHDYVLDRSGTLYDRNPFTEVRTPIEAIDTALTEKIFESVITDQLFEFKENDPGNTYKYIDIKSSMGNNKIVWSGKSKNNKLNLLYKELNILRQIKDK